MDNESVMYLAGAVAAWSVCKYVIFPVIHGFFSDRSREWVKTEAIRGYTENYNKITEERAKITAELARAGKSSVEISDVLDESLPFPGKPNIWA